MSEYPLFVSFHTPDPLYTTAAMRLKTSLERYKLPHKVLSCPDKGSWLNNSAFKANFILAMLRDWSENIVWVDADAEIVEEPLIFKELTADLAAVMHRGQELLTGTLFLRNCQEIKKLLENWIAANKAYPMRWEQNNLQMLLEMEPWKESIKFQELPHAYAHIFDFKYEDDALPVILQYQASRISVIC